MQLKLLKKIFFFEYEKLTEEDQDHGGKNFNIYFYFSQNSETKVRIQDFFFSNQNSEIFIFIFCLMWPQSTSIKKINVIFCASKVTQTNNQ